MYTAGQNAINKLEQREATGNRNHVELSVTDQNVTIYTTGVFVYYLFNTLPPNNHSENGKDTRFKSKS